RRHLCGRPHVEISRSPAEQAPPTNKSPCPETIVHRARRRRSESPSFVGTWSHKGDPCRPAGRALRDVDTSWRDPLPVVYLRPAYRRPAPLRTRSSCAIWIRLPDVSFAWAMVEPVTLVGGILNSAPAAFIRS